MASRHAELARLGWNEWFDERAGCGPEDTLARVAAVDRDGLLVMDQSGTFRARLAGRYRYRHHRPQEFPCVGDWVGVEKHPADEVGLVHMLLARRTALRRKSAGESVDNQLLGREMLQTKGVSETGEGRHTTVRRELIILAGGALVIDNPGMREFGIVGAESGIGDSFAGIIGLASGCRYRDCSHASEPGCAVCAALNSGDVCQEHYDSYIRSNLP